MNENNQYLHEVAITAIIVKDELDEYAWVSLEEAKNYRLIDGIYDELVMAENQRKGKKSEWTRFS